MSILKGITHVIIVFNTVEEFKKTNIGASAVICFGKDEDSIQGINYAVENKVPSWQLPNGYSWGTTPTLPKLAPVFTGEIAKELLSIAGRAADRLKATDFAKTVLAGRTFRVTTTTVEEVTKKEAVAV